MSNEEKENTEVKYRPWNHQIDLIWKINCRAVSNTTVISSTSFFLCLSLVFNSSQISIKNKWRCMYVRACIALDRDVLCNFNQRSIGKRRVDLTVKIYDKRRRTASAAFVSFNKSKHRWYVWQENYKRDRWTRQDNGGLISVERTRVSYAHDYICRVNVWRRCEALIHPVRTSSNASSEM